LVGNHNRDGLKNPAMFAGFFVGQKKKFQKIWMCELCSYLWTMSNTQQHIMSVFTIAISNEITGRVDFLECPTKADRARIAGEYVRTLSKYPTFIHANTFGDKTIVSFEDGKRVTLKFSERDL
jgi:hypothetical protein